MDLSCELIWYKVMLNCVIWLAQEQPTQLAFN